MIGSEDLFESLAYLDENLLLEACGGDCSADRHPADRPHCEVRGNAGLRTLLVAAATAVLLVAIGLSVVLMANRKDFPSDDISTMYSGAMGSPDDTKVPYDTGNSCDTEAPAVTTAPNDCVPDPFVPEGVEEITWKNLDGSLSFRHLVSGAKSEQIWYSTALYDLPATIPESVFLYGKAFGVGERTLVADRNGWQPMVRYRLAGCGMEVIFDGTTGQVIGYIGKELEALGAGAGAVVDTAGDEAKARELVTEVLPEAAIEEYELVQLSVASGESETVFCRFVGETATEDRITLSYQEGVLVGILAENSLTYADFDPAQLAGEEARLDKLENFCRYVCGENRLVSYEITGRVLARIREGAYKMKYTVILTAEGETGTGRTEMKVLLDLES